MDVLHPRADQTLEVYNAQFVLLRLSYDLLSPCRSVEEISLIMYRLERLKHFTMSSSIDDSWETLHKRIITLIASIMSDVAAWE